MDHVCSIEDEAKHSCREAEEVHRRIQDKSKDGEIAERHGEAKVRFGSLVAGVLEPVSRP